MDSYHIFCLSEALTPLTHMRGTAGNEALINREPVTTPLGTAWLPVLSGNSLRHSMVRAPGARRLVEEYDLGGALNLREVNFLFHGGVLTGSTSHEETAALVELRDLWPLYRVLGGSLPDQLCPGLLRADRGVMVCRENAQRLSALAPFGWGIDRAELDRLPSAEEWIDRYQYTRGEGGRTEQDLVERPNFPDAVGSESLMIYSGESICAGARFVHGFHLVRATEIELGAVVHSLQEWARHDGTVGGQSSKGHGRLRVKLAVVRNRSSAPANAEADAAAKKYEERIREVKDRAVAWLRARFRDGLKKKKGKK